MLVTTFLPLVGVVMVVANPDVRVTDVVEYVLISDVKAVPVAVSREPVVTMVVGTGVTRTFWNVIVG